jgi:HAD superfamily hydrolase (TIGR01549 family)
VVNHLILFDDVLPFLDALDGMPVAIVTNGSEEQQMTKMRTTGLGERVKTVVISEAVGLRKPDRRIFLHAARLLGVEPKDCVMVGEKVAGVSVVRDLIVTLHTLRLEAHWNPDINA